nr:FMRFamide receptor-like [Biomphalaria glabrata]
MSSLTILELSIKNLNDTDVTRATMTSESPVEYLDVSCLKHHNDVNMAFTVIRTTLAVFGVAANMVTAVVLTNRRLWSPTSMLLLSLVVYDAIFLLASIPPSVKGMFITNDLRGYSTLMGVSYPIRYMAQMGSIYTTVTVTVERFLIVLVPLQARVFCTFGNTRKILFAVLVFCIVFNIPRCFFNQLWDASDQLASRVFQGALRGWSSIPNEIEFSSLQKLYRP